LAGLDFLDYQIVALLNRNARFSSVQLARKLNHSPRTVRNRIRRLIDKNLIQPIAVVNPQAFGYHLGVDIFCEVEVGEMDNVVQALAQMPEITYLAYSTGEQDLSAQAVFKDSDEMQSFITRRLHLVPGIRRTRTVLVPRIVKDTYQWVPPKEAFESPSRRSRGRGHSASRARSGRR